MMYKNMKSALFFLAWFFLPAWAFASVLVDVEWLKTHQNDPNIKVIGSYQKGANFDKEHIPGSLRVDETEDLLDPYSEAGFDLPKEKQFIALMKRLGVGNNSTLVIYDDSYQFASRLFFLMEYYGHSLNKLKILDGGITAWKEAGLPTTDQVTQVTAKKPYMPGKPLTDLVISRFDIMADVVRNTQNTTTLLDVRPMKEWTGADSRGLIRTGHIPKAIHHAGVDEFMDKKTHKFRPASEIDFALEAKGVTKDKPVYIYCQGGSRTSHAYVVMKYILGYPNVKSYMGGWVEWASLPFLPVADEKWAWASAEKKAEGEKKKE
jgi:thiosulfate/3-mercaptopyruvate sulfurtransferase